jgi:hypothetical protein
VQLGDRTDDHNDYEYLDDHNKYNYLDDHNKYNCGVNDHQHFDDYFNVASVAGCGGPVHGVA